MYHDCVPESPWLHPPRPLADLVLFWGLLSRPVASSCAISCCTQVLRAAHLHRRAGEAAACLHACEYRWLFCFSGCSLYRNSNFLPFPKAGIAHQPCWLKSKGRRTPGRPVRGPHDDAQREDPRTPSTRTPRCPARGSDAQQESPYPPDIPTLLDQGKSFAPTNRSLEFTHFFTQTVLSIYGGGTLTKLLTLTLMPGCLDSAWSRDCRHELACVEVHPGRCLAGTRDGKWGQATSCLCSWEWPGEDTQ